MPPRRLLFLVYGNRMPVYLSSGTAGFRLDSLPDTGQVHIVDTTTNANSGSGVAPALVLVVRSVAWERCPHTKLVNHGGPEAVVLTVPVHPFFVATNEVWVRTLYLLSQPLRSMARA